MKKTHLLQIATIDNDNIIYKNVYGNDINTHVLNIRTFIQSDNKIDLANLLLNDNELYLTAEGIEKVDIIRDDVIKYLNRYEFRDILTDIIEMNIDDNGLTIDLPINGEELSFIMIIYNRVNSTTYYIITPMMFVSKLYSTNDETTVEVNLGSILHTSCKEDVISILNKILIKKLTLSKLNSIDEIYENEYVLLT